MNKIDAEKGLIDLRTEEARLLAEDILDAKVRLGEMLKEIPKAENQYAIRNGAKSKQEVTKELGFNKDMVQRFESLAENKDIIEQVKAEARENNDLPTQTDIIKSKLILVRIKSLVL